jgi:hypothetical protein
MRIEATCAPGDKLPTGPDEQLPPLAVRVEKELLRAGGGRGGRGGGRGGGGRGRERRGAEGSGGGDGSSRRGGGKRATEAATRRGDGERAKRSGGLGNPKQDPKPETLNPKP